MKHKQFLKKLLQNEKTLHFVENELSEQVFYGEKINIMINPINHVELRVNNKPKCYLDDFTAYVIDEDLCVEYNLAMAKVFGKEYINESKEYFYNKILVYSTELANNAKHNYLGFDMDFNIEHIKYNAYIADKLNEEYAEIHFVKPEELDR